MTRALARLCGGAVAAALLAGPVVAAAMREGPDPIIDEAKGACADQAYTDAIPAPLPTRGALMRLERGQRIASVPNAASEGRRPLRTYVRFYVARRYHGRLWYCGTFDDPRTEGLRPGVYLGHRGKVLDGGCSAGRLAFDTNTARLAFMECNGR